MQNFSLLILVLFASFSCRDSIDKFPDEPLKSWYDKSKGELFQNFKQTPEYEKKYHISKAIGEFRIGIQNTYPIGSPKSKEVIIHEVWWKEGNYFYTFFLHEVNGQWTVFHGFKWHKNKKS